jgi:hypothetical protein
MYNVQDAEGFYTAFYFLALVVFGAFFEVNLIFAVIYDKFAKKLDLSEEGLGSSSAEHEEIRKHKMLERLNTFYLEDQRLERAAATSPGAARARSMRQGSAKVSPDGVDAEASSGTSACMECGPIKCVVGGFRRFYEWPGIPSLHKFVDRKPVQRLVLFCIIANTVVLAVDAHPQDVLGVGSAGLESINLVLTWIFFAEMVLKLGGLGLKVYVQDALNTFDAFIVIVSMVELIMQATVGAQRSSLSALRTFRLFRLFKLARSWVSLRILIEIVYKVVLSMGNFGLLLGIFLLIFTLTGMQFFANKFKYDLDTHRAIEWNPIKYPYPIGGGAPAGSGHGQMTPQSPYEEPRQNFDTLLNAFTTVFQIITAEDWNYLMYDGVRATGWGSVFYFLLIVIIGDWTVLNLFLSIMLDAYKNEWAIQNMKKRVIERERQAASAARRGIVLKQMKIKIKAVNSMVKLTQLGDLPRRLSVGILAGAVKRKTSMVESTQELALSSVRTTDSTPDNAGDADPESVDTKGASSAGGASTSDVAGTLSSKNAAASVFLAKSSAKETTHMDSPTKSKAESAIGDIFGASKSAKVAVEGTDSAGSAKPAKKTAYDAPEYADEEEEEVESPARGPIHAMARVFVKGKVFETVVLFLILISSIALALDNPNHDKASALAQVLQGVDMVLTALFTIEMVLKLFAIGLRKYCDSGWNNLDGFIVITSLITTFGAGSDSLKSLRALRALRAMRPLRMVSRMPGMKQVVDAVLYCLKSTVEVSFVCGFFFLIFGIITTDLFKGKLQACDLDSLDAATQDQLQATYGFTRNTYKQPFMKADCLAFNATWNTPKPNFDSTPNSMMALLEMATTEGWIDIMYLAVDAVAVGQHPVQDWGENFKLFFVFFMMIGSFLSINLFIGAVIEAFHRKGHEANSHPDFSLMTQTQKEWVDVRRMMHRADLRPHAIRPEGRSRELCFDVAEGMYARQRCTNARGLNAVELKWEKRSKWFHNSITLCICMNAIVLASLRFQQSDTASFTMEILNNIFALVFLIEAVVKITGYGFSYYWKQTWNRMDFMIVLVSLIFTIVSYSSDVKIGGLANLARMVRLVLLVRVLKNAKIVQMLIDTVVENIFPMINITSVLCLVLFVYTIMGVQIFALVPNFEGAESKFFKTVFSIATRLTVECIFAELGPHANFHHFGSAFFTLIRCVTGESWNRLMYDLMQVQL